MAKITVGPLFTDIRNSIGNLVFSAWRGINYVRQKGISISNPNSLDQANIRARLSAVSKRWKEVLSQSQRNEWNEYAQQISEANGPGDQQGADPQIIIPLNGGQMSGFNSFVMLNSLLYSAGILPLGGFISVAPLGIDPPNPPTALAASWNDTTCCIDAIWTDPIAALSLSRIRVWVESYEASVHAQLVQSEDLSIEGSNICNIKIALGAQSPVRFHPGTYLVQVDCIGPNGQKSPNSNVVTVEVPPGCTP